jgi:heme/copper-type cytochrome/quinol oxidase subunit 2
LTKRERYSPNQSFLFAPLSSENREAREEKKMKAGLTLIELVWTITPSLILILIAFPAE